MAHYSLNYKISIRTPAAFGKHRSAPGVSRTAKHFMQFIQSRSPAVKDFLFVIQLCFQPKPCLSLLIIQSSPFLVL